MWEMFGIILIFVKRHLIRLAVVVVVEALG